MRTTETKTPNLFIWDADALRLAKTRLQGGDEELLPALNQLRLDADTAMKSEPVTVVSKPKLPPSGDKHDYMSMGPYWWPNPDTVDGLPYIRRDGVINPDSRLFDLPKLEALCDQIETLSLAYYYLGSDCYAERAAVLLRTWFLDEGTRVNPNLNFGQGIPGICSGRGIGIIETWNYCKLVEAVGLLECSPVWSLTDQEGLQQWFRDFLQWLLSSPYGKEEAKEHNNHGTYYDLQVVQFALFTEQKELAAQWLREHVHGRIQSQIEPNGLQPHEAGRTLGLSYSVMNLLGFCFLSRMGRLLECDIQGYVSEDGRSIEQGMDYLLPYLQSEQSWPYEQIKPMKAGWGLEILSVAAMMYQKASYLSAVRELKLGDLSSRINLVYPLHTFQLQ
ncbi:alginate lyase family protein [Paenibacillus sp. UNC451MF]|uniref:alginate lyase family protein n=1 Tax=Paenibacillus sp. UNC451MF TaxID=1449063 RepID=UPI00068F51FC|nr:alginate lyase family protein [Paenibacillus sp. UNC451MF]